MLINEITADVLDRFDEAAEQERLAVLTRDELLKIGQSYKAQVQLLETVELHCRIRASRLNNLGYEKNEIAEAFDVPKRTVAAWLRKVEPSVVV